MMQYEIYNICRSIKIINIFGEFIILCTKERHPISRDTYVMSIDWLSWSGKQIEMK